jgi:hypothetical protein
MAVLSVSGIQLEIVGTDQAVDERLQDRPDDRSAQSSFFKGSSPSADRRSVATWSSSFAGQRRVDF